MFDTQQLNIAMVSSPDQSHTSSPAVSSPSNHVADHATSATASTHGAAPGGGHAQPHEQSGGGNVFNELFGELGDHNGIILGPYHVADLPIILVDNGVHVYANEHSMEAAGLYTMVHHHPVRVADGGKPTLDMSITNFVFFQWLAFALIFVVVRIAAGRYKSKKNAAPTGIQNLVEVFVTYVRDNIVYSNLGARIGKKSLPFFLSLFHFIVGINLLGILPFGHTATSSIMVTGGLAIIAFFYINTKAIQEAGIGHFLHHFLGGAPVGLAPLMIPIEIMSLFIKPFVLAVRLFANMLAGHVVLLAFIGLIFYFKQFGTGVAMGVAPVSTALSVFIYCLESMVVFLQAFVFTMLTAVFTGMSIGHTDDHAADHH